MGKKFSLILAQGVLALAVLFTATPASAQSQGGGIKMTLVDAKSNEAVGFATVSLIPEGSSKAYKYVLSNHDGEVEFTGVKRGTFKMKAELMGYKQYETTVKVNGEVVKLGTVKMEPDVEVLDAANVSAVGNPIVVKKDTIEYNAASFRITESDMLEQLLKKLPGIEVSSDGSITANGEKITKITIDGKTFFLDDPQLASKNIPAKMIEKVKVVEKKSDQAMFTGIDDGEEETIIDLSIRPGMMQGWFGNVAAGGGHDLQHGFTDGDWRWQGSAMVGRFTNKSQISLILNGNNTNNRGFTDMAGGMMSAMRGGGGGMGGGMGGFGGGNGITTSWMGGLNGAWTLLNGNMDIGGNYVYNGSIREVLEHSDKITYLDTGDQLIYRNGGPSRYGRNDDYGYSNTTTQGHRFGIRLEHKFSKNTSIMFEPQVNFGYGNYGEYSDFETQRYSASTGITGITNKGWNNSIGRNSNWTTSGRFLLRQRLGLPGRTLSLNVNYNFSGNKLKDALNQSLTENYTFDPNDGQYKHENSDRDNIVNQRIASKSNSQSVNSRLAYTEPLGAGFYLEASYSYNWRRNYSNKDAYNTGLLDGAFEPGIYNPVGEVRDVTYSSEILNVNQTHNAGVTMQYQRNKLRMQLGASIMPTTTRNKTVANHKDIDTTYTVWNWSPTAMISYDFNDNANLRINYRGNSSQPSTSQLMPVPDNSNPLNVSFGNPYLKPYFSHSIRGNFGYTNRQNFFSIRGGVNAGMVQTPITNAQWYGENGAQYSMPINGPMTGNASIDFFVNSPIAKSNFSISNTFRANFSQSSSFIGKTGTFRTEDYYNAATAVFDYDKFNSDFFGKSATRNFDDYFSTNKIQNVSFTERLSVRFSSNLVELSLAGRTSYNKSWYTVQTDQKARWSNQASFSMNWTIPGGITIASDINYNWYNGYTTPQKDEYVWNAEISKLLFKKQFSLTLRAYDIMNQAKNLSITDASNYHQEVRNNTLGRYIILSLTYRFGTFGRNRGGSRGGRGGMMGPPGGFRGGMGGPPMM